MDAETGAILALQILALCSIVAALLVYLMRQSHNANEEFEMRSKRHVLVTSCDTCIGLQLALALSEAGYKVFAGLLDPSGNSHATRILRAMEQQRTRPKELSADEELETRHNPGQIVPVELDSTREDSLRDCLDAVRAKLPAGEDGLWAVVHTGGLALPGVIERQASAAWESMLRHNLVAPLRAARVFIPLLRAKRGRIILLGDSDISFGAKAGAGLVAFSASRKAVEGAAEALRAELLASGVDVVLLKPPPINPLALYSAPVLKTSDVETGVTSAEGTWVAPLSALAVKSSLIPALTSTCPYKSYNMDKKSRIFCQ
ncbi:D-beta-hydroxybutyrate dehydrogenase, mitochondrial-like [Phymastichus coffea]|uniref:D-beta-hydroxybutyrate dehydrogenase, mitochondrial-like n=1 Tax=Phymastichus coffea TaxID=108790 RepID=UPI00273BD0EE|nr:D-beta-hydroxybutyrate dehydrogenase, mitochondrial-like [Phymastichus coffea]XP_058797075.1 D-beta-hydroxybutyrate dehydrogenase, mitochondrial-like [Phymastichus coffea]XP_058797076.1 D-beta-hydroxybutyrate dehydrogenase, mitochondrial-like [Phymastichus coffea]